MLLCTEMCVLAGIFRVWLLFWAAAGTGIFGLALINTGRVDSHGHPCWFTVLSKKCVSRHISTRAVLIYTGARVDPLYCQKNVFSGHISTRAVLFYTGTRVKPPVLVFKLCFLCMLLSMDWSGFDVQCLTCFEYVFIEFLVLIDVCIE